jgi:hypothetical protein
MNNAEILGNFALIMGTVVFLGACIWVIYNLEKDEHKHKTKSKKA